ncbi:MAG: acetate--CoA ligase family protein [Haloferacaceae archaeon]
MASTDPDLDRLFDPDAVALVGASADPEKLSGRPRRFLAKHGYDGDVYLVNPSHDEIAGEPCYDSVTEVPGPVDLALVLVPAAATPAVVRECGEADVPFAVVIASGFSEVGEEGERLEADLLAAAEAGDVRVVGPNSEGVVNVPASVGASFSSILKSDDLVEGGLGFVTQSGAFGGALFRTTQDLGVGSSVWLSTGNEADVTTLDVLEYLVEDPATDVVVTYVEALTRGERLLEVGRRAVETDTDIVAMRVGRSAAGREATASHTGSVATDDDVYDALFAQAGVTRVRSVDAFADAVTAVSRVPSSSYPRREAGGLGVVSVSGGAAGLIADAADRFDVPIADLADDTRAALGEHVPPYGSTSNPVDVTGTVISDPSLVETCLRAVAADDDTTALLVQFGNSGGETIEVCKDVVVDVRESGLPVAAVFTGGRPRESTRQHLADRGVLTFADPVRAVRAVGTLVERADARERVPAVPDRRSRVEGARARDPFPEDWTGAVSALSEAGVSVVPSRVVDDPAAAVDAADDLGYPVACKYSPLAVDHKAEVDGLRLDLPDAAAVRTAAADLLDRGHAGELVVQSMVEGVEVVVGVGDDPDFGPVCTLGPGGTLVELFDGFAHRGLPVTSGTAREMVAETALEDLLGGVRGRPPADIDALCDLVAGLATAYETHDVRELECNPVVVTPDGAYALDLLVE